MLNNEEEIAKLQVLLNNLKNKQTSNVDENTPLLKKNNRSGSTMSNQEVQSVQVAPQVQTKPEKVKKPRPPKTEKQLEAFRKVQERRAEEIERKKQEQIYNSAKLLLEKNNINIETHRSKPAVTPQKSPVKKHKYQPVVNEDSSSDEEVYVVQSKRKKNVKKRIILESSDEESSDDEVQINRQSGYIDTSNYFV
jgi:hypothetical protein